MVVNLDLSIAGQSAILGFPEVKRGITIAAGGVPRLVKIVGHQRGRQIIFCWEIYSEIFPMFSLGAGINGTKYISDGSSAAWAGQPSCP